MQIIGNKASNLKWLSEHGFKTPHFIVLDEGSYREIISQPEKAALFFSRVQKEIGYPVAARSSFSGEDGAHQSFAGLFKTHLNIQNSTELLAAIQSVSESLNSQLVSDYCRHHEVAHPNWGSIIIQKMVSSSISGVALTTNPQNHLEMLISAGLGLGENIVSGEASTTEYFLKKQNFQQTHTESNEILSASQVQHLATRFSEIEKLKKSPQDVEWAIDAKGELYFLQARPVTITNTEHDSIYFDNSNIQESFTGITLPLTFSYAKNAYRHVYNQLMRVTGFSSREIEDHDWRHAHMLGLIQGRVYYNINSWYQGLLLLPHFGRNKQDMESMMGVETPIPTVQSVQLTNLEKLKMLPRMIRLLANMTIEFSFIRKSVARFDTQFNKLNDDFRKTKLRDLKIQDLVHYLNSVKNTGFALWGTPLVNDFYVMMYGGKIRRTLKHLGCEDAYSQILATHDLDSFKPIQMLADIATEIRNHKDLAGQLQKKHFVSIADLIDFVLPQNKHIAKGIQKYLELYGDRVIGEMKLETKTFRTQPDLFVSFLKSYIDGQTQVRHSQITTDSLPQMNWFARWSFSANLKKLQLGLRQRELMRLHRTRSFGIIREIYRTLGERLTQLQIIQSIEDIFYLTETEIEDFVFGQSFYPDFRDLVNLRKKLYSEYQNSGLNQNQVKLPYPASQGNSLSLNHDILKKSTLNHFKGHGCYPGIVKAQIKLVQKMEDAADLKGKILLAERTDPGWTPLFYLARAVIVEKGSVLSHAAIIAREIGIPVIIGIPGITQNLKDGEEVQVNGDTGEIIRINNS